LDGKGISNSPKKLAAHAIPRSRIVGGVPRPPLEALTVQRCPREPAAAVQLGGTVRAVRSRHNYFAQRGGGYLERSVDRAMTKTGSDNWKEIDRLEVRATRAEQWLKGDQERNRGPADRSHGSETDPSCR